MRILIINPPHPSIGSRIPREQLPPLGLLLIGGPLIDAGHEVRLIDGEFGPMPFDAIVRGEGEETAPKLIRALETRQPLRAIPGIACRHLGAPVATAPAPVITD